MAVDNKAEPISSDEVSSVTLLQVCVYCHVVTLLVTCDFYLDSYKPDDLIPMKFSSKHIFDTGGRISPHETEMLCNALK